jgi:hypothetical protein
LPASCISWFICEIELTGTWNDKMEMLEDVAHLKAELGGDRDPLLVELFQQTPDIRRDILPLAPAFASLHACHVAERDAHVILRVEVGQRDRHQAAAIDENGRRKGSLQTAGHRRCAMPARLRDRPVCAPCSH